MEVYIYRCIFIGVFCISVCYTSLILINVSISLILALTSWIYVPISLAISYLFTIVFMDMHYLDKSKTDQEY